MRLGRDLIHLVLGDGKFCREALSENDLSVKVKTLGDAWHDGAGGNQRKIKA